MTDTADLVKCGKCRFPIHPSETGVRHFGFYVAHSEERCTSLLQAALSSTQARAEAAEKVAEDLGEMARSRADELIAIQAELVEAKREIERLRENHRVAVHRKRVTGEYRDDFKARADKLEAELAEAKNITAMLRDNNRELVGMLDDANNRAEAAEASLAAANERLATLRNEVLEEAAKVVEAGQEIVTSRHGVDDQRTIEPRKPGNLLGLGYASAIRALKTAGKE